MSIERGLLSVAIWQKYCISRLSRRTMVQAKQKRNSSKGNSKMYLQYRVKVRIQLNNYVYLKDQRQHREGVWRLYRRSDRCDRASAVGRKRKPGSRLSNAPRSGPVRRIRTVVWQRRDVEGPTSGSKRFLRFDGADVTSQPDAGAVNELGAALMSDRDDLRGDRGHSSSEWRVDVSAARRHGPAYVMRKSFNPYNGTGYYSYRPLMNTSSMCNDLLLRTLVSDKVEYNTKTYGSVAFNAVSRWCSYVGHYIAHFDSDFYETLWHWPLSFDVKMTIWFTHFVGSCPPNLNVQWLFIHELVLERRR